jgi:hypothetical protein
MTRAAYAPSPGSVAQRAIAHLETLPARTELSAGVIAEAIGVPVNNLKPCLEAPLKAGMLVARQKYPHPRAPFFWSLPVARETNEADPAPDAEASGSQTPEGADSEGRAEAGSDARSLGRQADTGREAATAPTHDRQVTEEQRHADERRASAPRQTAPLVGTNASMSLTGEIAIVAECGTVILFDARRARGLVAFLAGRAAA